MFGPTGDPIGLGFSHQYLAVAAGRREQAYAHHRKSLSWQGKAGNKHGLVGALEAAVVHALEVDTGPTPPEQVCLDTSGSYG